MGPGGRVASRADEHRWRRAAAPGGIDTLETHYSTTAGILHQPLQLAEAAAKELLDWLGFSNVVRG
jgi:hypothetical protein